MVNHHRRVLRLAAEHGLTIDPHEYLKPTGETRTYPNLVSAEAVRGMEHNAWGTGNPPSHSITLPFTRMLGGPLDYTPGIFALRWDPSDSGTRVHTTLAHQLALFPMLLSGLQMAADTPDHYEGHPALPFVEAVPATWDETRVLHDAVGECASIARRNGDAWFVGTATDERERTVDVPLGVLDDGPYVARCYSDAPETDLAANPEAVDVHACLVDAETTIRAPMASGGGQALHVEPATDADADLPRYDPDRLPRRGID
jgi:alpha-glucosidase